MFDGTEYSFISYLIRFVLSSRRQRRVSMDASLCHSANSYKCISPKRDHYSSSSNSLPSSSPSSPANRSSSSALAITFSIIPNVVFNGNPTTLS